MKWEYLLIKKAIISRIPFAEVIRNIKRHWLGYQPNEKNLDATIENYQKIKTLLAEQQQTIKGAVVLEIGSGWFPVIPVLMARDGAKKIIMSDLNVHMNEVTFKETIKYLASRFPDDEFIQNLTTFAALPIEYLAPFDMAVIDDGILSLVISHNVLEHIPKNALYRLFSALKPKLANNGLMIHLVDHSDHFEHHDKSISKINFLTWSEQKHALIYWLAQSGENRMRHHEYYPLFSDAGYQVVNEERFVNQTTLNSLNYSALTYPYSKMQPEQLATLCSIYTLKPL